MQNELFNSPASSEGWISLSGQMLAKHPGQYILTVSSFSGGGGGGGRGRGGSGGQEGRGTVRQGVKAVWHYSSTLLCLRGDGQ